MKLFELHDDFASAFYAFKHQVLLQIFPPVISKFQSEMYFYLFLPCLFTWYDSMPYENASELLDLYAAKFVHFASSL